MSQDFVIDVLLPLFNFFNLTVFISLSAIALSRQLWRVYLYRRAKERIPALVRRNVVLFGTVFIFMTITLYFRAAGIIPSQEPWYPAWSFLGGGGITAAVAYWVYVELFELDNPYIP